MNVRSNCEYSEFIRRIIAPNIRYNEIAIFGTDIVPVAHNRTTGGRPAVRLGCALSGFHWRRKCAQRVMNNMLHTCANAHINIAHNMEWMEMVERLKCARWKAIEAILWKRVLLQARRILPFAEYEHKSI